MLLFTVLLVTAPMVQMLVARLLVFNRRRLSDSFAFAGSLPECRGVVVTYIGRRASNAIATSHADTLYMFVMCIHLHCTVFKHRLPKQTRRLVPQQLLNDWPGHPQPAVTSCERFRSSFPPLPAMARPELLGFSCTPRELYSGVRHTPI